MFVVHKSNIPLKFSSLFFHHHQRKKVWELKRGEETNTRHHQALHRGKTSKLMTHHNNVTQDKKDIISFLVWWKGKENIEINKKIHFCIDVICIARNVPCIFSTLVPAPPAPPSYYYKLCQVFVFDIEKNCEMVIWAGRSKSREEGTSIHVKSSSWPLQPAQVSICINMIFHFHFVQPSPAQPSKLSLWVFYWDWDTGLTGPSH